MHSLEFPGRRRALAAFAAALGAAVAGPVLGAPGGLPSNIGHADSSPEWDRLRERLFGQRPLIAGEASKVQLQVPLRATFGASVPVKVVSRIPQTPGLSVRRLWLVVDKNPSGLSATQYNALRILRGAGPDGLPCGEVAARMITRDPDVTRLLDRLEKRGLIRREILPADRRCHALFFDGAGEALFLAAREKIRAFEEGVATRLSKLEQRELARLLAKLQGSGEAVSGS